jgi:hypothetical protein
MSDAQTQVPTNPNWNPCEARLAAIEAMLLRYEARFTKIEQALGAFAALAQAASELTGSGAETLSQIDAIQKTAYSAWREAKAIRKKAGITDAEVAQIGVSKK